MESKGVRKGGAEYKSKRMMLIVVEGDGRMGGEGKQVDKSQREWIVCRD